jgi:hypothetical protein
MIMKRVCDPLKFALVLLAVIQLLPAVVMAEVSYRISYLPVVSTDFPNAFIVESTINMNTRGDLLFGEIRPYGNGVQQIMHITSTVGPGKVESYPIPVSPHRARFQVLPRFTDKREFAVFEIGSGVAEGYLFTGSRYAILTEAGAALDWSEPMGPITLTADGILYSARNDGGVVPTAWDHDNKGNWWVTDYYEVQPGIYRHTDSGSVSRVYDDPDSRNQPGWDKVNVPNRNGTILMRHRTSGRFAFYNGTIGPFLETPDFPTPYRITHPIGHIAGWDADSCWVWLIEPAFGLDPGLHTWQLGSVERIFLNTDHPVLMAMTKEQGQTHYILEDNVWQKMRMFDPARPGFRPNVWDRIYGFTPQGDIVAGNYDAESNFSVMIMKRVEPIRTTARVSPARVEPGEEFELTVIIENTSEDPYVWCGTHPQSFRVYGSAAAGLEQTANPPPVAWVPPGESFVQRFLWKAPKAGRVRFSLKGEGRYAGGAAVQSDTVVTGDVQIGGDPLQIELETLPLVHERKGDTRKVPIVNMLVQEDPENDGQYIVTENVDGKDEQEVINPRVRMKVTNVYQNKTSVTARLQGLDPRARDKSPLGARIKVKEGISIDLGTIEHGTSIERVFELDIRDDGRFEFQALLTAVTADTGEQYNIVSRGAPIAVGQPYPVEIELKHVESSTINDAKNGNFFVKPGSGVHIIATVVNKTSNSRLEFKGIRTKPNDFQRNAFGGVLTSEKGRNFFIPLVHDHAVDPEGSTVLGGDITTEVRGYPTGQISWQLPGQGEARLVDIDNRSITELTEDDFLVRPTYGEYIGDPLTVRIVQDYRQDPVPFRSVSERFGVVTSTALDTMENWVVDSFVGFGALAHHIVSDPTAVFRAMGACAQGIYYSAEHAHTTWKNMTAEEKEELVAAVFEEVQARQELFFLTGSPISAEEQHAALEATRQATYFLFSDIEKAYASNDPLEITRVWTRVGSNVLLEAATGFLPTPKFGKYTTLADARKLAKNADAAKFSTQAEKYLRVLKGPMSFLQARTYWGIGGRELSNVQSVLKRLGMKGFARERNPRSIQLIESLKEAIWKPEKMKPKGISEIDRLLLGEERYARIQSRLRSVNDSSQTLDPDGITAIFKPEPEKVIRQRLAGQPDHIVESVIERARLRESEFTEYSAKFKEWYYDGMEVDFNYTGNGATIPAGTPKGAKRRFEYRDLGDEDLPVLIPKMADEAGNLKYISGDVDWVHFSWLDGTPLSPEDAARLYSILSRCCGLQHGETLSWIKNGQTVFKNKISQLAEYSVGEASKALLEVTGDSLRAVRIDPRKTMFAPDGRSHLIFFDEGTKVMRQLRNSAEIENLRRTVFNTFSRANLVHLPRLWRYSGEDEPADVSGWTIENSRYAEMVRQAAYSTLERFDGEEWRQFNPENPGTTFHQSPGRRTSTQEPPVRSNSLSVAISPYTALASEAFAGDTHLDVFNFSLYTEEELGLTLVDWFAPGDRIVIAPGLPSQEVRFVVEGNLLSLNAPLEFDHPDGTYIAVVPQGMQLVEKPYEVPLSVQLIEDTPEGMIIDLTWETTGNRSYFVERSSTLKPEDWEPVTEAADSNGYVSVLRIRLAPEDQSYFYRVRFVTGSD